ncbi:MAG: hypothetical protein QM719_05795 [Thermomonas sp.]
MAKVFSGKRIVPVWVAAARSLNKAKAQGRTERNYVLEIASPTLLMQADLPVISAVDSKLRNAKKELSLETVAGTLFPNGLYRRYGRPAFYDHYLNAIERGRDKNTWGTYAVRMIERTNPKTKATFNPLDIIVQKLQTAKNGRRIHAAYELGLVAPADLIDESVADFGCELPLYDPATDGGRPTNIPCLSHLSFKLNDDDSVDLTAVYRSHHYAQRALGNLIGLSQLLAFVAAEAGLKPGTLTCVSTQAHLDVATWGGVEATDALLATFPDEEVA